MEIIRTHKIKLDVPVETVQPILDAWHQACNLASELAFANGCVRNAVKLHRLCYAELKALGLSAQVAQSAIRHVASKYVTLYKLKRKPERPAYFRFGNAVVLQGGERERDFGFKAKGVSLWTTGGRLKGVSFHGGPMLSDYLENWRLGDGRLFVRDGNVYLSVSFSKSIEPAFKPNDAVIGVDRGINYIAAATDGDDTLFFGGGNVKHVRRKYQNTRASLQRKKAQRTGNRSVNSRSIRRVLKRQSGKQARFMRNENHVISRRIIEFATTTGNPTIAIERLDGIREQRQRKEQRRELNQWAFYQLEQFLRYKAEARGFDVIEVDPHNTSRGCSRCGYMSKSNRHRNNFKCKACGYTTHADRNAALNVRSRGILARQLSYEDGVTSTTPEARNPKGLTGKPLPLGSGG